jgi:hypothetical protein
VRGASRCGDWKTGCRNGGPRVFRWRVDRLYAAIVLSSSLSILLFAIVVLIERRLIRY